MSARSDSCATRRCPRPTARRSCRGRPSAPRTRPETAWSDCSQAGPWRSAARSARGSSVWRVAAAHSRPRPWGPHRPAPRLFPPAAAARRPRSSWGGPGAPSGSTTLHPQSQGPSRDGPPRGGSGGHVPLFSRVGAIGTGNPVLGALPAHLELGEGTSNGLAADLTWGDAFGIGNFGHQVERPDTGRLAEGARALMQQRPQLLAADRIEHRVRAPMRRGGAGRQDGQPVGIEAMDDIAHSLVVAAEAVGNHAGGLAPGAGEQDLAAAQDKGLRRAEASVERLLFGGREGSHMNWVSHVRYRTTFPIALLETALGGGPEANCTVTFAVPGGNIMTEFLNNPPPAKTFAITGGTGIYRNARGQGELVESGHETATLTFDLIGGGDE